MITIIAAFILTFNPAVAEVPTLKVRPYNRIFDNKKISLLDIVDRENLNPIIEKRLAAVSLGDAPKIGEQRVYSNHIIAEAIRQGAHEKKWNFQIPHKVTVDNRGYDLDKETIEKEIISHWKSQCSGCQIIIKSSQMPSLPKALVSRPWTLEFDSRFPRGNFSQKLIVNTVEGRAQIFWINGQIEVKKKVPVLTRSTPMGTRFTLEDFQYELRDVTFATDATPQGKEIIGQQAKYTMNANDIIWRGSLVREKAVQRGEMVKVSVAGSENWEVTLQARTEQDGYVGDTVNIRNLQSNKVITGRVIASGEVEIK